MTLQDPRHVGRVLRGAVLLVPLLLAGWWLWSRPDRGPSRFDDALDRALAPVMQQSELEQRVRLLTSSQARLVARDLAERSVPYLGPRDLELWAATRTRVARASLSACSNLWKGGDETFLGPAIADLGPDALDAYVQMLARALALRLEVLRLQQQPPPLPQSSVIERGFATIAKQLPADARAELEQNVNRRDVSDTQACRLFLTVSTGAEKLEPNLRADFYRALACALEVPHGGPAPARK